MVERGACIASASVRQRMHIVGIWSAAAPMIYIEFTSRRPQPGLRENDRGTLAVESFESQLQRFHRAVLAGQSGWEGSWSEDQMILSMGRTWRLGPEPEYMTVWYTPTAGLGRIDDWDKVFRSGEADESRNRSVSSHGSTGRDAMRRCWTRGAAARTGSTTRSSSSPSARTTRSARCTRSAPRHTRI